VVGFFDFIPLVGTTIGTIVVALATVAVRVTTATIVWIAFIIAWPRLEGYVVQPLVYGRAVNVNPLLTIISLLVGRRAPGEPRGPARHPERAAIQIILREWWSARASQLRVSV
jgi:predicted PurR-regulated permease PerM